MTRTRSQLKSKVNNQNQEIIMLRRRMNALMKRVKDSVAKPSTSLSMGNEVPVSRVPTWSGVSKPIRIHQEERVASVTSASSGTGFNVTKYVINPANGTTFPWLSSIAALFDKYKFHKLEFRYITSSPTSVGGNVSLAVDFDTLDAAPTSGVAMSNLAKFNTFATWANERLTIPVNRRGNSEWLYTEDGNTSSNDPKSYNLGNLYVSTESVTANTTTGYLVVEYDVELLDKNPN